MRVIMLVAALLIVPIAIQADPSREWCGTPSPSRALAVPFVEQLRQIDRPVVSIAKSSIAIPIAFHVVHDGKSGRLTAQHIAILIENLNWAFRDSPYTFYLYRLDSIKNRSWYNNCAINSTNLKKLRKRLALDVRYYLNVYSCKPGKAGLLGIATFPPGYPVPGNPGLTYLQGVAVDPVGLGSAEYPYGFVLAHEIGHYLGLFHTFESFFNPGLSNCADPGDFVGDTATQAFHTGGDCPVGLDSCPALPGADDIPNFMNYSTDECMDHFSPGQIEMINFALGNYRPTLGTR